MKALACSVQNQDWSCYHCWKKRIYCWIGLDLSTLISRTQVLQIVQKRFIKPLVLWKKSWEIYTCAITLQRTSQLKSQYIYTTPNPIFGVGCNYNIQYTVRRNPRQNCLVRVSIRLLYKSSYLLIFKQVLRIIHKNLGEKKLSHIVIMIISQNYCSGVRHHSEFY